MTIKFFLSPKGEKGTGLNTFSVPPPKQYKSKVSILTLKKKKKLMSWWVTEGSTRGRCCPSQANPFNVKAV